jgi:hypothetical protein
MRAISVSRVVPALLTRTSRSPSSDSTRSTSAWASAGSPTFAPAAIPPISAAIASAASLPER